MKNEDKMKKKQKKAEKASWLLGSGMAKQAQNAIKEHEKRKKAAMKGLFGDKD